MMKKILQAFEDPANDILQPFQEPAKVCICGHSYEQHRHFNCKHHDHHRTAAAWYDMACLVRDKKGKYCKCEIFQSKKPAFNWFPRTLWKGASQEMRGQ